MSHKKKLELDESSLFSNRTIKTGAKAIGKITIANQNKKNKSICIWSPSHIFYYRFKLSRKDINTLRIFAK